MWSVKDAHEAEVDDELINGPSGASITSINDPDNDINKSERFYAYKFDATVSEAHRASATVTKFPVSSGFLVSDHIIKHNRMLTLKVVTANMVNDSTWLLSVPGAMVVTGAVFGSAIGTVAGNAATLLQTSFETQDRVSNAYKKFCKFMEEGTRLYVSTILGTYLNCIVVDIQTIQDKDSSAVMAAEITLEELQVADINSDTRALAARKAMLEMKDRDGLIKMAESVGINALGLLK